MKSDFRKRIVFYYNTFARAYDLSEFFRRGTRGAVVQASGCQAGERVLEICSGTCELALAFSRQNIQVVAVDLAHDMLQLGKRKSTSNNLACIEADALKLPFPDKSFNAVVVSLALHHMPEPVQIKVLREMARLASDRVVALEWHTPSTPVMRTLKGLLIRLMDVSEYIQSWMHQDFPASCRQAGLEIEHEEILTVGFHRLTVCSLVN
jgi:ubiquinone/menaquinone biosynthesis C-methylase UbiE